MKKLLFGALLLLAASCTKKQEPFALLPVSNFDTTLNGKAVSLYTIRGGDLTMQVTNYGARVVTLWAPDREGRYEDVVLGYQNIDRYVNNTGERFLGAVVGRCANRIARGTFTLDGETYTLPQNDHGQTLHGGLNGLDRVVWNVDSVKADRLVLSYLAADGEEGFPGNLSITMTYTLTPENGFEITYRATTDKPTVANISHHSFFNLKGEGNGTVTDNLLTINGSAITPVDSVLIPTGEILPVEGTPFDFRSARTIGERIDQENVQLKNGRGYDMNWVIDRKSPDDVEWIASLYEPVSGRGIEVWSDQPALQFYSGNFFDGSTTGKTGKPLRFRESVALETQKYPDGPNHPDFPSTILRPGEVYTHTCLYKFFTK